MKAGNVLYSGPRDLPQTIPVFPLADALLLPLGQMPLNIFEPRYLAMIDAALAGDRIIGMIQPAPVDPGESAPRLMAVGCAGRITAWSETGQGRYQVTLTGIARFNLLAEIPTDRMFRMCRVSYDGFTQDFGEAGGGNVDRAALLKAFRDFLDANSLSADWDSIERTPTDLLVNTLSMMSPYGRAEKQALLEARDLRARAETLVALTEASLAGGSSSRTLN